MVRLRIGNSFDGKHPTEAMIKEFRAGQRELGEYTFKTLPLNQISPNFPPSKEITVNEIRRFFDRKTQPRMTTGATMFANLRAVDEEKWYSRTPDERMYGDFEDNIRSYGASSLADESIGLQFRLYRVDGNYKTVEAYFDNSRLEVSNILWEFSSDGGEKWFPLYDLPNRAYTRITLPKQATRIKVRALSNNLEDWVQAFAITPKPDLQKIGNEGDREIDVIGSLKISRFGYLTWNKVGGSTGNVVYEIYRKEEDKDKLIATTIEKSYQLPEFNVDDKFYIVAVDELGNRSASNVVTYDYDDIFYKWLNYNLVFYRNSGTVDEENGTFTDEVNGLTYVFGPPNAIVGEDFFIDESLLGEYNEELEQIEIPGRYERFTAEGEAEDGNVVITTLTESQYEDGELDGFESEEDGVANIENAYIGKEVDRYIIGSNEELPI